MNSGDEQEITLLLKAWRAGDSAALERLTPLVYDHLRRLARLHMRDERPGATLQATALVHEAYLRLAGLTRMDWQDRAHFFAVAAQTMRRILVGSARARKRVKRGGGYARIAHSSPLALDRLPAIGPNEDAKFLALDDALAELGEADPRRERVVELRFFGGLSVEECAEVLRISPQSVMRDWKLAKAFLKLRLATAR